VFDKCFSHIYDIVHRRKTLVFVLVLVVALGAGTSLIWVPFDNDVELMLPANEEVSRTIRFLRESNFSDKVVIWLKLESPQRDASDLIAAVDDLAASLGPPLVTEAVSGISETGMIDETLFFFKYIPQLIDEKSLHEIEKQINPQAVQERLAGIYRQLLGPGGQMAAPFVRADPLGTGTNILRNAQKLSSWLGANVSIVDGHFITHDGNNAMLILETSVPVTDVTGSRKLISYLQQHLRVLPDYISPVIIAGHLHSISNEEIMKSDIQKTLTVASLAFILFLVFAFRDIRAMTILVVPMVSVAVAVSLASLALGTLSYFIIGMGAVIVGIAVDYGIHVFIAVRKTGNRHTAVKKIAKPALSGALTTISVFASFYFSSVAGYHQLALFSIISIVFCILFALLVLPHIFKKSKPASSAPVPVETDVPIYIRKLKKVWVGGWFVFMVLVVTFGNRVSFNNDIRQYDGSDREILQAEQHFNNVWGNEGNPAFFVVPGDTLEQASQVNDIVYQEASAAIGNDNFSSLASIWPSRKTRTENVKRWESFWSQGREIELKELLEQHGGQFHFTADAFAPFFDSIYNTNIVDDVPEEISFLGRLKERFVIGSENGYRQLSYFPDEEQYIKELSSISERHPGSFLVSRRTLSSALSRAVSSEIVYIAGTAGVSILVLTLLLLKNVRLALLALIPVASGIGGIVAIMPLVGKPLNAAAIIAAMIVVGLCVDYGIFMVYHCRYNLRAGTRTAVTLSAATTLVGAGALLFARHPMLFTIGLTLVTGVLSGYISSMLVVPSLYLMQKKSVKAGV
jgi:uncharacterized protein